MEWQEGDKERLKRIIKQTSGALDPDDGPLIESVTIKGTGDLWCYAPMSKQMTLVARGSRVYVISDKEDEEGRVMIYTATVEIVYIDKDELMQTGFN